MGIHQLRCGRLGGVLFPKRSLYKENLPRFGVGNEGNVEGSWNQTALGPGITIVYLRDRFYVTMSPGASSCFALPIAHMFGFLDDNFALTSQYKEGRFQIQHGVQRMSLVLVQQPGLSLRFGSDQNLSWKYPGLQRVLGAETGSTNRQRQRWTIMTLWSIGTTLCSFCNIYFEIYFSKRPAYLQDKRLCRRLSCAAGLTRY